MLRFLLALIVAVGHAVPGWVFLGYFAVICFFILSGYWISSLFHRQYTQEQHPLFVFYTSRLWRLVPTLLLFTIAALVMQALFDRSFMLQVQQLSGFAQTRFWLSHVFVFGLALLKFRLLGPAWSLDIELQFYGVFPLLYLCVSRFGKRGLLSLALLSALAYLFIRCLPVLQFSFIKPTFLYYSPFFLAGMLLYWWPVVCSRYIVLVCNLALLVITALLYAQVLPRSSALINEIMAVLMIPLISNCVTRKSDAKDAWLGNISYVLYLAHWLWIIPYRQWVTANTGAQVLLFCAYLLLTGITSYVAYRYFDAKVNRARKRWMARQAALVSGE
ncbi:acyltransferase family protein [Deminuibacter soli]|nr:acyltransferase [Deminuibacter soli]